MAILKIKKLIEDIENGSTQVLSSIGMVATTASYAGTSVKATSAGNAGTALKATSAGNSGTAQFAITAATGTSGSSL